MGGKRNVSLPLSWPMATKGYAGTTLRENEKPAEASGQLSLTERRQKEMLLSTMVEGVIGRRILLHPLLDPADFAQTCSRKEFNTPTPPLCGVADVPFRVSFLSHCLFTAFECLTIRSEGCMNIACGYKADFQMELSLERISVSLTSVAMQWTRGCEPLTLNFNSSPLSLTEAAFSFDIHLEGTAHEGPCSGCGFLVIMN
jgi:hypothetical protein